MSDTFSIFYVPSRAHCAQFYRFFLRRFVALLGFRVALEAASVAARFFAFDAVDLAALVALPALADLAGATAGDSASLPGGDVALGVTATFPGPRGSANGFTRRYTSFCVRLRSVSTLICTRTASNTLRT